MNWSVGFLMMVVLSVPALALAQGYQPLQPPPQGQPQYLQLAPPDPHQFCYVNGQPYSMGSPYPGNGQGNGGGAMRCQPSEQPVNGYYMMEWSDRP